eukprot:2446559-Amphidinium_carterae.1
MYEVLGSEGDFYPAIITKIRSNGRYAADLYGGGHKVHYPSVKYAEIRRRQRHDRVDRSRSVPRRGGQYMR